MVIDIEKNRIVQMLALVGFFVGVFSVWGPTPVFAARYVGGCDVPGSSFTKASDTTVRFDCGEGGSLSPVGDGSKTYGTIANIICSGGPPGTNPPDPQITKDSSGKLIVECSSAFQAIISSQQEFSLDPENPVSSSSGSASTGSGGPTSLPECTSQQANGQVNGECSDTFTRCVNPDGTPGEYGVQTSQGQCIPLDPNADDTPLSENPILVFLGRMITFLSAGIGIILVLVVVVAGLRYTLARGNPQESAAAKSMIEKAIISVVMYLFAFGLINWLVPGGLLN